MQEKEKVILQELDFQEMKRLRLQTWARNPIKGKLCYNDCQIISLYDWSFTNYSI